MYGSQVGRKFNEDGTAKRYPGNTVIADVCPGCDAYDALTRLRLVAYKAGMDRYMIMLPEDSYHITIIRGLNDLARDKAYWPQALPLDSSMSQVDDYFESAVDGVASLGGLSFRFIGVRATEEDLRVLVAPADEYQARGLSGFRDAVADAIKLRLPGHDTYSYHITLAYTRVVPQGDELAKGRAALEEMNSILEKVAQSFKTDAPYIAFYDDMLRFYDHRIPRDM